MRLILHYAVILKVLRCDIAAGRGSANRLWTGEAYAYLAAHISAAHAMTMVLQIPQVLQLDNMVLKLLCAVRKRPSALPICMRQRLSS